MYIFYRVINVKNIQTSISTRFYKIFQNFLIKIFKIFGMKIPVYIENKKNDIFSYKTKIINILCEIISIFVHFHKISSMILKFQIRIHTL